MLGGERHPEEIIASVDKGLYAVQFGGGQVGRVSRIDAMQQQSMAVSTRGKALLKLKKVQASLKAIESGDYGLCRQCDEAISFGRLNAQPQANLCLICQDKADRHS